MGKNLFLIIFYYSKTNFLIPMILKIMIIIYLIKNIAGMLNVINPKTLKEHMGSAQSVQQLKQNY